jgi:hypothetical protein
VQSLHKSLPGNVTSEMGLKIGDLADMARNYPDLINYLQTAADTGFYAGMDQIQY